MDTNHHGWKRQHLTGFTTLSPVEEEKYTDWRFNHKCLSTVYFTVHPSPVGQSAYVICNSCGEKVNLTDYDSF